MPGAALGIAPGGARSSHPEQTNSISIAPPGPQRHQKARACLRCQAGIYCPGNSRKENEDGKMGVPHGQHQL